MIRVIIERTAKLGKGGDLRERLLTLRASGIRQPGYVSGETLVGYHDPYLIIVISTWRSYEHWQNWADSAERRRQKAALDPLLAAPEKITVLQYLDEE